MATLSLTGFPSRMRVYLSEMFPVTQRFVLAVLLYVAIAAFTAYTQNTLIELVSPATAVGVWSIFAMFLIVRLMDEIKDKDIDRALFPDRPLPSGRVLETDIVLCLVVAIVLYLIANMWVGSAIWPALMVLGYVLMMFRHFFIPEILNNSLLLTFATHSPLFLVIEFYGFAVSAAEIRSPISGLDWGMISLFAVMLWLPTLAWEVARKIRMPEQEDGYTTYSKIFGRFGAILICTSLQAFSLGIGGYLQFRLSLPYTYVVVLAIGFYGTALCNVLFLITPDRYSAALRPAAETYIFAVLLAQLVGFSEGIDWGVLP